MRLPFLWCGKRDLNPYGVNHTPLKRARLPVPPLPRITHYCAQRIYYTPFSKNVNPFLKKSFKKIGEILLFFDFILKNRLFYRNKKQKIRKNEVTLDRVCTHSQGSLLIVLDI